MFSLKSFILAIQEAILNASDALMEKNMDLLNQYFETDDDGSIQEQIEEAINSAEEVLDPSKKTTRQSLNVALDSIRNLRDTLDTPGLSGHDLNDIRLHPKTVAMNFPTKGKDGTLINKEVRVPLLTLVPIQFSQVEELKLNANLELNIVDDEVFIHLGKPQPAGGANPAGDPAAKSSIGNVEIIIKPREISDGMQHIVDAYEKVLKSQLPL